MRSVSACFGFTSLPLWNNLLWNHLWGDAQEISLCLETRVRLYAEWGSRWVEVCLYFLKQNSYGSSSKKKVPGKQFKCKLRIWKLIPFNANYAQQPLKSLGTFSCTAASDAFSSLLSHPKFPFHDSGFSNRPPGHYCSAHLDFSL